MLVPTSSSAGPLPSSVAQLPPPSSSSSVTLVPTSSSAGPVPLPLPSSVGQGPSPSSTQQPQKSNLDWKYFSDLLCTIKKLKDKITETALLAELKLLKKSKLYKNNCSLGERCSKFKIKLISLKVENLDLKSEVADLESTKINFRKRCSKAKKGESKCLKHTLNMIDSLGAINTM